MEFEGFFRDTRMNTYLSWTLTVLIASVFIESLIDFDWAWTMFSGLVLAITVLPAISQKDLSVMVPWEVLALTVIPVTVRSLDSAILTSEIAVFAGIAATALIVAVELHVFTPVKFTHGFAIGFTVITTLAIGGLYAIVRYISDLYLGTAYLSTNDALMYEFIEISVTGILAGFLFDLYFGERDNAFRKMISKVINK